MRKAVFALIGLGLVAIIAIGLAQSGGGQDATSAASPAATLRALAGAPPPLAALHAQGNRLLGSSPAAFTGRLRALQGHPVVLNGWASWCGPCRAEYPFLQRASVTYGKRVAFLGLNTLDEHAAAERFAKEDPVSYPSYEDPRGGIGQKLRAPRGLPYTLFLDRRGKVSYVHQGGYATQAKLEEDIRRYALGAS